MVAQARDAAVRIAVAGDLRDAALPAKPVDELPLGGVDGALDPRQVDLLEALGAVVEEL